MKILVVSNLYPPHHAGTFDFRCEAVVEKLKQRGHELLVLTSRHGLTNDQIDAEIARRLILNGKFGHSLVTGYGELKELESHNNDVLRETIEAWSPDLVCVWSLEGLSKSLVFALRNIKVPSVFSVSDDWLSQGLAEDPWLRWWNSPGGPGSGGALRKTLELTGQRDRINRTIPTRLMKGYERVPELYGERDPSVPLEPGSIGAFHFERLYFCSNALKAQAEAAGFRVGHGRVIASGIPTEKFYAELKPLAAPIKKFLLVARLTAESGAMTALEALRIARQNGVQATLSVYGRGESEQIAPLRSFVIKHGLPVEFLNVSNQQKDLAAVYRQHDAFLYTAEWHEPFAITPLEAMAAGLPVIATTTGGVRDVIRHGENGLTYPPGDAATLASRMQELQIQPALRAQMSETAQAEVMTLYNESTMLDQLDSYLQETLQIWQDS